MDKRPAITTGHPTGLPPEAHNDEQDPVGEQAQDVAADARREDSRTSSPLESTKPDADPYDPAPDSTGDLVDEMRRMEGAGAIDMSAFAGEPNHDDEPGTYGGETTDDADADWLTADGEASADEADMLDSEGLTEEVRLLREAEMFDEDDITAQDLPDDEED
jgi:hypothetical protein